jgi:hypothetical protein
MTNDSGLRQCVTVKVIPKNKVERRNKVKSGGGSSLVTEVKKGNNKVLSFSGNNIKKIRNQPYLLFKTLVIGDHPHTPTNLILSSKPY